MKICGVECVWLDTHSGVSSYEGWTDSGLHVSVDVSDEVVYGRLYRQRPDRASETLCEATADSIEEVRLRLELAMRSLVRQVAS